VKNKNNYTAMYFCTKFVGNVSWFGASNYYIGSYIGISYSTHVRDSPSVSLDKTYLSTLSNPIIYTYYNATIAIVTYTLYQTVHGLNIPICNLSVLEILSLSRFGISVESSSGLTRIVFSNSSGKYVYYLPIGNGSVKLFYTYFGEFVKTLKSLPYGYAYEEEGKVNATKNVFIGSNTIGVTTYYFSNLRSTNLTEIYLLNPVVNMFISHGNAQVYFSYFVYSTGWGIPIEGFILNYTSYYEGLKYEKANMP